MNISAFFAEYGFVLPRTRVQQQLAINKKTFVQFMRIMVCALGIVLCSVNIILATGAKGQDLNKTKIKIELRGGTLLDAVKKIEKATPFVFAYNKGELSKVQITHFITTGRESRSVKEILDMLFWNTQLQYEQIGDNIVISEKKPLSIMALVNSSISAPAAKISGVVTDENGSPLQDVSVFVKGSTKGTKTNAAGKFTFDAEIGAILVFSYTGYETIEQAAGENMSVRMQKTNAQMDEVVVIGYGTAKKKDLTGGVASISAERLEKMPAPTIAKRLQGQIAGMTITSGSVVPGAGNTVRIRGEKSLSGGNDPLVVLDGIPYSGGLNQIDQSSVENISVLKDASAAAIYGARAANGVILITSKKGKNGKVQVGYNGYVGVQTPERLYKLQNGTQSIELLKQYLRDMGSAESFWSDPTQFLPSLPKENYMAGKEFDWQNDLFNAALQQEHQLNLSGGTDRNNYYASLTYTDQDGIVKNTGLTKIAATINMTQKIGKWLTVGTNTQLSQRQIGNGKVAPSASQAFYLSPWSNPYDSAGNYNRYPMYTTTYWTNPYADDGAISDDKLRTIFTGWYADIVLPVKGLSFRTNFGYTFQTANTGSYYGKATLTGQADNGVANIYNSTYTDWTWENVLRYDRNFGEHHLDFTGLMSSQKTTSENFSTKGKNFLNDENGYHNIAVAQGEKTMTSSEASTSMISYMGRINYNYARKYLLTITARSDGYSAFGPNNKWAFFPSIAGGWVISDENFFRNLNIKPIDYLKLRLSYGANGNQAVTAYKTFTKLSQLDYIYGDGSTFAGGLYSGFEVGNPNLRWESTYSLNGGLDFSLFDSRLSGSLDVYSTDTKDLLMSRTVPVMNGYTSMLDNIGKTHTKGFEVTLNTVNVKHNDFEWSTSLVGSGNWNKIVALREDGKDDLANAWFIGKPIRVFYDYKVIGIWQEADKTEAAKYGAKPGDARLWDKSENNTIDAADRDVIGSKLPVWTAGMTNTFSYKDITLSFFLNGIFDITKENGMLNFQGRQLDKFTNYITTVNYWTPENHSTEATRLGYNPKNSHKFYNDASYVRLQDITLSYRFPKKIIDKLTLQKLGIYINVTNVCTFSKINKYGINPEQDIIGSSSSYPVPRTFVFGMNVTF